MGHTGDEAKREARTLALLRGFVLILLLVLTCGSAANVWYTLSTENTERFPVTGEVGGQAGGVTTGPRGTLGVEGARSGGGGRA